MSDIEFRRVHWHVGGGVLTMTAAGEQIVAVEMTPDQMMGLARDLMRDAARLVDAMRGRG